MRKPTSSNKLMLGKSCLSVQKGAYDLLSSYRMLIVAIHGRGGESLALRAEMLVIGRQVVPTDSKSLASTWSFFMSQGNNSRLAKPLLYIWAEQVR